MPTNTGGSGSLIGHSQTGNLPRSGFRSVGAGNRDVPNRQIDLFALLRRRWPSLALLLILAAFGSLAASSYLPSLYAAKTKLILERTDPGLFEAVPELRRDTLDREAIETELYLINSREIAGRVVDRLRLVGDPFFNPLLPTEDPSATAGEESSPPSQERPEFVRLLAKAGNGASLVANWLRDRLAPREEASGAPTPAEMWEATISSFLAKTQASQAGASLALTIGVSHSDPVRAAEIANGYAQEYIDATLSRQRDRTRRAIDFLERRSSDLVTDISRNEQLMTRLRNDNDLDDVDLPQRLRAQIAQINVQLALARDQLAPAEEASAGSASSETIASLVSRIAALRDALDVRGAAEIRSRQIEREVTADRERLRSVSDRLGNLDLQAEALHVPARIVSPAQVPNRANSPDRVLIVLAGVGGVGLLAFVGLLVSETLDDRVRTQGDLAQIAPAGLDVPTIGQTPDLGRRRRANSSHPHRHLLGSPRSGGPAAFANLFSGCRRFLDGRAGGAIVVTSCGDGDGRTTTALALAATASRNGYRTAFVDLDPSPRQTVGKGSKTRRCSLLVHLRGDCGLRDVAYRRSDLPEVHVFDFGGTDSAPPSCDEQPASGASSPAGAGPSGISAANAEPSTHDEAVMRMIGSLRASYDVVVVDTPSVVSVDDVALYAQAADLTLLVVRWGQTRSAAAASALRKLGWFSETPIATVINRIGARRQPDFDRSVLRRTAGANRLDMLAGRTA